MKTVIKQIYRSRVYAGGWKKVHQDSYGTRYHIVPYDGSSVITIKKFADCDDLKHMEAISAHDAKSCDKIYKTYWGLVRAGIKPKVKLFDSVISGFRVSVSSK